MAWRIQSRKYSCVVEIKMMMMDVVRWRGQELERQEVGKGLFTPLAQILFCFKLWVAVTQFQSSVHSIVGWYCFQMAKQPTKMQSWNSHRCVVEIKMKAEFETCTIVPLHIVLLVPRIRWLPKAPSWILKGQRPFFWPLHDSGREINDLVWSHCKMIMKSVMQCFYENMR